MKPGTSFKTDNEDDETVRYKLNTQFFDSKKSSPKSHKQEKTSPLKNDYDDVLYKFPDVPLDNKPILHQPKQVTPSRKSSSASKGNGKLKHKNKIKVNFWSAKNNARRVQNQEPAKSTRRNTVANPDDILQSQIRIAAVKLRKRVSFLPSPLFNDNHIPMVTVPDDLTIHFNEEEANELENDLKEGSNNLLKVAKAKTSSSKSVPSSPKGLKRKLPITNTPTSTHSPGYSNENELEFFTKYVVQKLRKMETNQRIYSENLIHTVLMLGQLNKLSGKSKIIDT